MKVSQDQKAAMNKKIDRAMALTRIIEKGHRKTSIVKLDRGSLSEYVVINNMCKIASKELTSLMKDIAEFRNQISGQSQK